MKTEIAINVKNLSKKYSINDEEFFALKNVSFILEKGQSIGLVGKNGSGKSTLLKILSGQIKPSSGEALINGKVNSLIEIGSHFILDLTGEQNAIMFLKMRGVPKNEIPQLIKKIQDFSDLNKYFYLPVKFYSSGMFVRLAVACGFNINADIYLIDEVLMAGDSEFKEKVYAVFRNLLKSGVSIILASHNPEVILNNCSKALWLNNGNTKVYNDAKIVLDSYEEEQARLISEKNYYPKEYYHDNTFKSVNELSNEEIENENFKLIDFSVEPIQESISYENGFRINLVYIMKRKKKVFPLFKIFDHKLNPILVISSSNHSNVYKEIYSSEMNKVNLVCVFPKHILSRGNYFIQLTAGENPVKNNVHTKEAFKLEKKLSFCIPNSTFDFTGATHDIFIKPLCEWELSIS